MKKVVLLALITLLLGSCDNNSIPTNDSSSNTDSNTSSISEETNSSGSDITIPTDITTVSSTAKVIKITNVITYPENVYKDSIISPKNVLIELELDDGRTISDNPDYIETDFANKSDGENVVSTVHYQEFTATFESVLRDYVVDIITPEISGGAASYTPWSYTSALSNARYDGITGTSNGAFKFSGNIVSAGKPGILTPISAGAIRKVKINWNESTKDSGGNIVGIYGKNTPFVDEEDLLDLSDCSLIHNFTFDLNNLSDEYEVVDNYHYCAIITNGVLCVDSFEIYWDTYSPASELTKMEFNGSLSALTTDSEYNMDEFYVTGTYSDGNVVDITRLCNIEILTPIPNEANENFEVSVKATYLRSEALTLTENVKAVITRGKPTVAKFVYPDLICGGEISVSGFSKDGLFYKENASADQITHIQILNNEAYWATSPSTILATLNIGGSANLSFDEDHGVYVELLGENGDVIEGTRKLVFTNSTKAEVAFEIEFSNIDNVFGIRVSHKKVSRKNLRVYGIMLQYDN